MTQIMPILRNGLGNGLGNASMTWGMAWGGDSGSVGL